MTFPFLRRSRSLAATQGRECETASELDRLRIRLGFYEVSSGLKVSTGSYTVS